MSIYPQYYVYAYISRKSGLPYYIGKGKNGRAFEKHYYGIFRPKEKFRIVFLETNLTDVGAIALERRYIRWYGRRDIGTGILLNKTDGGEGVSGRVCSEETRRKRSITMQTPEVKAKRSVALKGKNKGRKHTGQALENIREARKRTIISDALRERMKSRGTRQVLVLNVRRERCIYCGFEGNPGNIGRYHNEKCKRMEVKIAARD